MAKFLNWLKTQQNRADATGTFAKAAQADNEFPKRDNISSIINYLRNRGANDKILEAAGRVFDEFTLSLKQAGSADTKSSDNKARITATNPKPNASRDSSFPSPEKRGRPGRLAKEAAIETPQKASAKAGKPPKTIDAPRATEKTGKTASQQKTTETDAAKPAPKKAGRPAKVITLNAGRDKPVKSLKLPRAAELASSLNEGGKTSRKTKHEAAGNSHPALKKAGRPRKSGGATTVEVSFTTTGVSETADAQGQPGDAGTKNTEQKGKTGRKGVSKVQTSAQVPSAPVRQTGKKNNSEKKPKTQNGLPERLLPLERQLRDARLLLNALFGDNFAESNPAQVIDYAKAMLSAEQNRSLQHSLTDLAEALQRFASRLIGPARNAY